MNTTPLPHYQPWRQQYPPQPPPIILPGHDFPEFGLQSQLVELEKHLAECMGELKQLRAMYNLLLETICGILDDKQNQAFKELFETRW